MTADRDVAVKFVAAGRMTHAAKTSAAPAHNRSIPGAFRPDRFVEDGTIMGQSTRLFLIKSLSTYRAWIRRFIGDQ